MNGGPTPSPVLARLSALFDASRVVRQGSFLGDDVALVPREHVYEVLRTVRDDPELSFDMLTDLTVVDYLHQEPRFELVYQLYSVRRNHRLRVKVPVSSAEPDDCWAPSIVSLWRAANWAEREAYDLYGVVFREHPDLRRILMYEEFQGHPLRKDYPQNGRQPLIRRPDAPPTDDLTTRLRAGSHDRTIE